MSLPAGGEALLETLRAEGGTALRWRRHAARMAASAAALGLPFTEEAFGEAVARALPGGAGEEACRIRVTLAAEGLLEARSLPLPAVPPQIHLALSPCRVEPSDPRAGHKLLPRGLYDAARRHAEAQGAWDGLLRNERDELCETGCANLVLLLDGELLTPARFCGLLPGTVRGALLEAGVVREATLLEGVLEEAAALFVTNALIGVREVTGIQWSRFVRVPEASRAALETMRAALRE